jgi:hypothetical protein
MVFCTAHKHTNRRTYVRVYGKEKLRLLPMKPYNVGNNGNQNSLGIPDPINLAWRTSCGSTCNFPIILNCHQNLNRQIFLKLLNINFYEKLLLNS